MDHNDIRHKLSEYIDESLTDRERSEVESHLTTCQQCSDALHELQKTVEHIRNVEEVEPPAWLHQKIMANVRAEAERKKSWFERFFRPYSIKLPIQAVAVLFLTVTAFYIYRSIPPARKPSEAPMQEPAAEQQAVARSETVKPAGTAPQARQVPQTPGYKSLDMKQEYEKPAPPMPMDTTGAFAPAPENKAEQPLPAKETAVEAPRAAAPAELRSQAGSAETAEPAAAKRKAFGMSEQAGKGRSDAVSGDRQETEDIISLTRYFIERDLPGDMRNKGMQSNVSGLSGNLSGSEWIDEPVRKALQACSRKYRVEVSSTGRQQVYFYCMDDALIRLIAQYELINTKWNRIR